MKQGYLILVCLLLVAGSALAQIDPNDNGVGIYADVGGLVNEVDIEVGEPMEVYLLLTNPTGDQSLGGWEGSLVVPGNVEIWGFNYPNPQTLALVNGFDFAAVHQAVPYQTVNLLMTFIIMPQDCQPAQFFIEPTSGGSENPTAPRYLDMPAEGTNNMILLDMVPFPSGGQVASFTVNGGALPAESTTLDGVKALYR